MASVSVAGMVSSRRSTICATAETISPFSRSDPTSRSGKTIVIEGTIIYYEAAGSSGGALSAFEEAVAEVHLLDKDTGQTIATAHCIGRSTTFMSKGAEEKADRLGRSIAAWVAEHYPKRPDVEDE